jgi:anti-anti-sigma factor
MWGDSNDTAPRTGARDSDRPWPGLPSGQSFDPAGDTAKGADAQPTMRFSVRRCRTAFCPLLRVQGPLTDRTAPLLAAAVDPLTRRGRSGEVRVILTAVTEMTVAGAEPLLRAERRLRRSGGRLVLSQPSLIVRALLSGTELDRHFQIDPPV